MRRIPRELPTAVAVIAPILREVVQLAEELGLEGVHIPKSISEGYFVVSDHEGKERVLPHPEWELGLFWREGPKAGAAEGSSY
jgi:signal recognition particle subunit SEC65